MKHEKEDNTVYDYSQSKSISIVKGKTLKVTGYATIFINPKIDPREPREASQAEITIEEELEQKRIIRNHSKNEKTKKTCGCF